MKLGRRDLLLFAAAAAALPAASRVTRAQTYPTRPVRIIVGFAPGGPTDIHARLISQWLSERLGQPFIIENRPGASSNIGVETVVRAPRDGYTLLLVNATNAINATLYEGLNFDLLRDIAPVAGLNRGTMVLVVGQSFPAKTVSEFIVYAKANAHTVNMASAGVGTPNHVSGELFKMMTGVSMTHVPYRGEAPALADVIGGQVQVMFSGTAASIEFIRDGRLRALAVASAMRLEALPSTPTVAEFVEGFEASSWNGIGAPRGTPPEVIDTLNREIRAGLASERIRARYSELGATPLATSPADFEKLIAGDIEKWAKVIRAANIKPG